MFFHACNESDHLQLRPERHYTPTFALPWQCDIIEYLSIRFHSGTVPV